MLEKYYIKTISSLRILRLRVTQILAFALPVPLLVFFDWVQATV